MNENEMMNENDVEVLDTETDVSEVSSSGNTFNYGVAAVGAAVLGGLITAGVIIRNKIKAKKEATEADKPEKKEKPKKEHKGLKVGKGKYLQVVELDQRTPQVEEPKKEEK